MSVEIKSEYPQKGALRENIEAILVAIVIALFVPGEYAGSRIVFSLWAFFTGIIMVVAVLTAIISFVVAVAKDSIRKHPRGWIHQIGVGTVVATAVLSVLLTSFSFLYQVL